MDFELPGDDDPRRVAVRTWLDFRGKRKGPLHELFLEPLARIPIPAAPPRVAAHSAALARALTHASEAGASDGVRHALDEAVAAAYGLSTGEP